MDGTHNGWNLPTALRFLDEYKQLGSICINILYGIKCSIFEDHLQIGWSMIRIQGVQGSRVRVKQLIITSP